MILELAKKDFICIHQMEEKLFIVQVIGNLQNDTNIPKQNHKFGILNAENVDGFPIHLHHNQAGGRMMKLRDFIELLDIEVLNIYLHSEFLFKCKSDSPVLNFYKENEIEEIRIDFVERLIKIYLEN